MEAAAAPVARTAVSAEPVAKVARVHLATPTGAWGARAGSVPTAEVPEAPEALAQRRVAPAEAGATVAPRSATAAVATAAKAEPGGLPRRVLPGTVEVAATAAMAPAADPAAMAVMLAPGANPSTALVVTAATVATVATHLEATAPAGTAATERSVARAIPMERRAKEATAAMGRHPVATAGWGEISSIPTCKANRAIPIRAR